MFKFIWFFLFSYKPQHQIIHKARNENMLMKMVVSILKIKEQVKQKDQIRSAKLVQKGKEITNITGCKVFVDVVPTWENGERSRFMS